MRVSDQSFHGKHVISADGSIIGTVNAMYIDGTNLHVDCIAVSVRKDFAERLGVDHGVFHKGILEIPANQIQSVGETIVLSVPAAALRGPSRQVVTEHPMPPPEVRSDAERPIPRRP
jgi:sporulation protein YlmC with PRC-barrel domain